MYNWYSSRSQILVTIYVYIGTAYFKSSNYLFDSIQFCNPNDSSPNLWENDVIESQTAPSKSNPAVENSLKQLSNAADRTFQETNR